MPPDLFRLLQPPFTLNGAEEARQAIEELGCSAVSSLQTRHTKAICAYASGHYKSLDEAFSLIAPKHHRKGAPRKVASRIDAGNQIEIRLLQGESMAEVADRLSDASLHGNGIDETHVRQKYWEYRKLRRQFWSIPFMTAELAGRIIDLVGLPDCDVEGHMPQTQRKSKTKKSANLRSS